MALYEIPITELLYACCYDSLGLRVLLVFAAGVLLFITPTRKQYVVGFVFPGLLALILPTLLPTYAVPKSPQAFAFLWSLTLGVLIFTIVYKHVYKQNDLYRLSKFVNGLMIVAFLLLLFVLMFSQGEHRLTWKQATMASLTVMFFFALYHSRFWTLLPISSNREYAKMLLCVAVGLFLFRGAVWTYAGFNAAQKIRLGSFTLDGVTFAQDTAQSWQFNRLQNLIDTHWLYPVHPDSKTLEPPRVTDLSLLREGTVQAEAFRRSLFQPSSNGTTHAELIVQSIIEFQRLSAPYLTDHISLERFPLHHDDLLQMMQVSDYDLSGHEVFGDFTGRWYGLWDKMSVDHHWYPVEEFVPPIDVMNDGSLLISSLQYAWIGDGFGWNIIAKTGGSDTKGSVVLGIVYHVDDHDTSQITKFRPHLGLWIDYGKIIWITAGEIFLEERLQPRKMEEMYAITGFNYVIENDKLKIDGEAFQAVYTRTSFRRKPFYHYQVDLLVAK